MPHFRDANPQFDKLVNPGARPPPVRLESRLRWVQAQRCGRYETSRSLRHPAS